MYKNVFQTGYYVLSSGVVLCQNEPQFCLDTPAYGDVLPAS